MNSKNSHGVRRVYNTVALSQTRSKGRRALRKTPSGLRMPLEYRFVSLPYNDAR